jgi:hypothetical protein
MEFHDYEPFGKKMIARRYQDDPESGTELVANIVLLEDLKKPDISLFSIGQPTPPEQRLQSLVVSQANIERAAEGQRSLAWPPLARNQPGDPPTSDCCPSEGSFLSEKPLVLKPRLPV